MTPTGELPDFRTAVYFKDTYDENPSNRRRRLRLRDESERPLVASGMTPLNGALQDFQLWYQGGPNQSCDLDPGENPIGWCQYAAVFDLNWNCRQKYVLMITDGDETCDLPSGDENYPACDTAGDLLTDGVRTFVVGFGLPEDEDNALQCMAEQGGTGDPILPKNKDELVEALLALFSQVKAEQRAFASASIPAVQSAAADKNYFTSFFPVPDQGFWPGRLDVFRAPVPLTDDLRPDVSATCSDDRQSACHLYDLAERILDQAPDDDTIDNFSLSPAERFRIQIGGDDITTSDQNEELQINASSRRVFYGMDNPTMDRTQPLRLLWPNSYDDVNAGPYRLDLAEVLVPTDEWVDYNADIATCDPDDGTCDSVDEALDGDLQFTVSQLLRKKQVTLLDEDGEQIQCTGDPTDTSEPCTYVMGDVFHANPQIVVSANDFDFFRQDLCGTPVAEGTASGCVPAEQFSSAADMRARGYREYTRRTTWRRRLLATATNDGQLHFFDAGKYIQVDDPTNAGESIDVFTDGSGYELFSYMPRMVMPIVRDQANEGDQEVGTQHIYSMDGSPRTSDVFIDPLPNEFGEYEVNDREWRTVMIGGVREAGDVFDAANDVLDFRSGYYALDVSHPDPMVRPTDSAGNELSEFAPWVPRNPGRFLPECMAVDEDSGLQTTVAGCETLSGDAVPFPLELWQFQDTVEVDGIRYPLDEDINGFRDLGDTWSTPVIGQIMVCNGGNQCRRDSNNASQRTDLEIRWVAIFGGGMDPEHKNSPVLGNWIYFLDIETGEVIYKQEVDGAVPSDPAVLDTNADGILDYVYVGTTAGKLYKIDLRALEDSGKVPSIRQQEIGDAKIVGWEDLDFSVDPPVPVPDASERKFEVNRIIHPAWEPYVIFDIGEPIYYPPTLFRIPEREQYGFTIATGDREDLWEENGQIGYVVVGVDESFTPDSVGLPLTIADLARFPWDSTEGAYTDSAGDEQTIEAASTENLLTNSPAPRPGWTMVFPEEFRATGEIFSLTNVMVFSMFRPLNFTVEDLGGDDDDVSVSSETVCSRSGTTYAFVVFLNSSAPLLIEEEEGLDDDDGDTTDPGDCDTGDCGTDTGSGTDASGNSCGGRCEVINEFTTAIHTESSVSKNPIDSFEDDGDPSTTSHNRPQTERERKLSNAIREAVLDLSPRTCQFNEKYEILVSALRNSTGLNVYARIPLLICPGDWKN
ncbi:MAG: PilC/PilY family type IV pilus protein [Acidobacteriota bacterium]